MTGLLILRTTPQRFEGEGGLTITNVAGSNLYVTLTQDGTIQNTLTPGQSLSIESARWLYSAGKTYAFFDSERELDHLPGADLVREGEYEAHSAGEAADITLLRAGYNPWTNLYDPDGTGDNTNQWAGADFVVVTTNGTGNRAYMRSLALRNVGDPPELVFGRAGPDNSGAYGPNGNGTGAEGSPEGSGIGFASWMGYSMGGSYQNHLCRIGARLQEDSRNGNAICTLASPITLNASLKSITVNESMDAAVGDNDALAMPFPSMGKVRLPGATDVHYSHRTSTKLFGLSWDAANDNAVFSSGATVIYRFSRSGGKLQLRTSTLGTADRELKMSLDHDGALLVGAAAAAGNRPYFLGVKGGQARIEALGPPTGLAGTPVGTTGATSRTYAVVGRNAQGIQTSFASVTIANGNATLSETNYNKLTWVGPSYGIYSWDVIRDPLGTPVALALGLRDLDGATRGFCDIGQAAVSKNEIQSVQILDAIGGTYTVALDAVTSAAITYDPNDSSATRVSKLQTALNAMANLGSGQTVVANASSNMVTVTFTGTLAATNVSQLVATSNLIGAEDPDPTDDVLPNPPSINVRTRQTGGPTTYTMPTRDSTADLIVDGALTLSQFMEMPELSTDPAAPAGDKARLYCIDNGSGKTLLRVRFNTGAIQTIATQP